MADLNIKGPFVMELEGVVVRGEKNPDGQWEVTSPVLDDCPEWVGSADDITGALTLAIEYLRRA